jgi:hypothetical protein
LIVWIWQIRDLRRIIKKLTGRSVEELEPPYLQVGGNNPSGEKICPSCRRHISIESTICDNCGFKL